MAPKKAVAAAAKETKSTNNKNKVKDGKISRSNKKSLSSRAGLTFPIARVHRHLKSAKLAKKTSHAAAVYLTAVVEYLVAELMELAGDAAKDNKKTRIIPRHIMLAIKYDPELDIIFKDATISQAGVVPHIEKVLLPVRTPSNGNKKNNKKAKVVEAPEEEEEDSE